jgi:hydroxyethylthiazole kinase
MQMKLGHWLNRVQQGRPLVHNITNLVVMNTVANTLLAVGAAPVMAHAVEEVAEMTRISKALCLNIGTVDADVVTAMRLAGCEANRCGVPVVFDPVGTGATPFRTDSVERLVAEVQVDILRGNAGEIGQLVGSGGSVIGVDSHGTNADLPEAMRRYALAFGTVLVATGAVDIVTDGETIWKLYNGHPMLARVTGMGCALTGLVGAFVGVVSRGGQANFETAGNWRASQAILPSNSAATLRVYAEAAMAAITCLNVAAELAAERADGPGSFYIALLDALYQMTPATIESRLRKEQMK